MEKNFALLYSKFKIIKEMGYIKSTRKGTTGVGKTFEDLIGKPEDQMDNPDYEGIEIKTKLGFSNSYTTLFCLTPQDKTDSAIKRLVKTYGYPDSTLKKIKILQNSVYGNFLQLIQNRFLFRLQVDYDSKKVFLEILDLSLRLIEREIFWTFEELETRFLKKMKQLAIIKAKKKTKKNENYYHYYQIHFYTAKEFSLFLLCIEKGLIRVTFHIGVFKSGSRLGEIHDRGTSFEMKEENITQLYQRIF